MAQPDYLLTVVSPAYNEAENLPVLYDHLVATLDPAGVTWEWIVVDDHSSDATFQVVQQLSNRDARVSGVRFARNCGSHAAIACGLQRARGSCAVMLAADLQDPPSVIISLLEKWKTGVQVVWATRLRREGESVSTVSFSRFYYWLMRNFVGLKDMPPDGADVFLLDRLVINALGEFPENNTSVLALITWLGFRQDTIGYVKQARLHGRSKWNLEKKLKLVVDSITSFSYMPIRLISYAGAASLGIGLVGAVALITRALTGGAVEGWLWVMVVLLATSGLQMLTLGVLGEYLWRALDESRRRPRYLIEATVSRS